MRVSFASRQVATAVGAALLVSLSLATDGQDSRAVPNAGPSRWLYQGMGHFQSTGLLAGYPSHLESPKSRLMSRYELAVAYHAAASNLETFLAETKTTSTRLGSEEASTTEGEQDRKEARERIAFLHKWEKDGSTSYLTRASRELAPELRTLGVPDHYLDSVIKDLRKEATELKAPQDKGVVQQFPDVPPNHWAAQAVLELRQLGILVGYPDGTFRG